MTEPADTEVPVAGSRRFGLAGHWLIVLSVRGLGAGSGILASMVASRLMGADAVGNVFLALTIVTVLSNMSRLGLDNALVRFVGMHAAAGEWLQVKGVIRLALKWAAWASLAVAVVLFLSAGLLASHVFHKPNVAPMLRSLAWLVPLMASYWLRGQGLIGLRRPEVATMLQNVSLSAGFIAFLGLGLALGAPLPRMTLAAIAYTLSGLATWLLANALWRSKLPAAALSGDAHFDAALLRRTAAPLWITATMVQVVNWSGQIVSGAYLSTADVARLAVAQRNAMVINMVLMVTNMLVAPRFAVLYRQGDTAGLKRLVRRSVWSMTAAVTPIVVAVMFGAKPLMGLFGPGFAAGAPLLKVLVFGQCASVAVGSVALLLQMTGHERDVRNITVVSGCFSIIAAIVLTQLFGAIGAAWATAIAVIGQNVSALLMVRRRLGFFIWGWD